jgi:hypothetical protein
LTHCLEETGKIGDDAAKNTATIEKEEDEMIRISDEFHTGFILATPSTFSRCRP